MSSRRTTVPWDKATAGEVADWLGMLKPPRIPAVPAIGANATDEEWHTARDAGVGASDIGVIMGLSKFSSPYASWWQKHLHLRLPGTDQTNDGHTLEPIVAREFAVRHPELMVTTPSPRLWAHRDHPWAMCTPDRLAVQVGEPMTLEGAWDEEAARGIRTSACTPRHGTADPHVVPVELKWDDSPGWGPSGGDQVPEAYRLQVMWQAWVLGAPGGWLVNHKPSGRNRYREYWLPLDMAVIDRAWAQGRAFVASLETGVSPDPDGSKATEEVLRAINADFSADEVADVHPMLAEEWRAARADRAAAIGRARELDNRLREAMGGAGIATDAATGAVIARRNVYKRTGYEVGPALIDELRMVKDDGASGPDREVPEADGEAGNDGPAAAAGTAQAAAGADGDGDGAAGAGGIADYPPECALCAADKHCELHGVIPASPELVALGDALRAQVAQSGERFITVAGQELTPEVIQALAAEAEAGYDLDRLVPRRDPGCATPPELDTQPVDLTTSMLLREAADLRTVMLLREAQASVALDKGDGETQSVEGAHTRHRRPSDG